MTRILSQESPLRRLSDVDPFYAPEACFYIAGPMSRRPMQNARAFARIGLDLRELGINVQNPSEHDLADGIFKNEDIVAEARDEVLKQDLILMLSECTGVVVLPGSMNSDGCRLELSVAAVCGLKIYEIDVPTDGVVDYQDKGIVRKGWALRPMNEATVDALRSTFNSTDNE